MLNFRATISCVFNLISVRTSHVETRFFSTSGSWSRNAYIVNTLNYDEKKQLGDEYHGKEIEVKEEKEVILLSWPRAKWRQRVS